MNNKIIIFGVWEGIALLVNSLCSRIFLNYPRIIVESSGRAAWIEVLYTAVLTFIILTLIVKLYSKFAGKDLLDISEYAFGSLGRIIIGMEIVLLFLYVTPLLIREYAEDMKVIALPITPISIVMLFFVIPMIISSYLGIEAITRFHAIVVPIIAAAYLVLMLGVSKYYDLSNFYPILGKGAYKIFGTGFLSINSFAPIIYLFLIPPFIKTHKNFKAIGFISLGISAFFSLISVLVFLAVIPINSGIELFLPVFQLARIINYGIFLQRVESIFILSWATSALMYLSVIFFFTIYVFKKTFKLVYMQPLIIPFAIIMFSLSLLPQSLMVAVTFETKYYSLFGWIITLVSPMIVLITANIKKKFI